MPATEATSIARKQTREQRVEQALRESQSNAVGEATDFFELARAAITSYPDPVDDKQTPKDPRPPAPNDYCSLHALRGEFQELYEAVKTLDAAQWPRAVVLAYALKQQKVVK